MNSLPALSKKIGNYNVAGTASAETTILAAAGYNGGKPFTITFARPISLDWPLPPGYPQLVIRDFFSEAVLTTVAWPSGGYLGRALVIDGVVNIFGTYDYLGQRGPSKFVRSTLDASWAPSSTQVIFTMPAGVYGGLGGVTQDADGKFSCLYSNQYGYAFLVYPDATFTNPVNIPTGQPVGPIYYQNAQWFGGYWYALTLAQDAAGRWVSGFTRSSNRICWTLGNKCFITPEDMLLMEGTNASDVTWIEYAGEVHGVYLSGDQATWSGIRKFRYPKPLASFFAEFF